MERTVATVLFADLVDSTRLLASADPEVVRRRVNRYFEVVSQRIEAHGGTVEKFAGDAVMAAFGVPVAHEDDAERALRAALEIVPRMEELQLTVRIGVESGEVVVEDGESTFATGEAVNLAARLQQAAQPGEVLLGPGARRLTAGAIEVDDVGPLEIRGRAEPVWAWRAVRADDTSRLVATPFVGREPELAVLENSLARAVRDRRAQLVTIFGEPGLGKSRLVMQFGDGLERVTTLSGRTLPYGEGVTYWPLAAMIKASVGIGDADPAGDSRSRGPSCSTFGRRGAAASAARARSISPRSMRRKAKSWRVRFLEEIAHALRDGEGVHGIPDTLQALIASRIDGLSADEKCLLQSAALVGRVFWQGRSNGSNRSSTSRRCSSVCSNGSWSFRKGTRASPASLRSISSTS